MNIELIRIVEREDATLGVLCIDGWPRFATLELPWRWNEPNVSCIPTGRYHAIRVKSPKHGETFELQGVPDRSDILFHSGNTEEDTSGCILLGNRFGVTYGKSMIIESRDAKDWFLRHLGNVNEAEVTVRATYSTGATAV